MKPKIDSWNDASSESQGSRGVRRSLSRAGLQLGQLTHVVSGALNNLQGGSNARTSAQNRMKALLNQDRQLLSHRPCAEASLLDEPENVPAVPRKGSQTRGAAQNRMRELLNQDRAMLAFRAREGLDVDEDLDVVLDLALQHTKDEAVSAVSTVSTAARVSCVGVTTSFVAEEEVASVCTPGPVAKAEPVPVKVEPVAAPVVKVVPVVQVAAAEVAPAAPAIKRETREVKDEEAELDPIRTRGIAKLLAMQGYRERALSIYDELIVAEPNNAELRAEADKLRGH